MRTTAPGYRNSVLGLAVITMMVAALMVAVPGPAHATGFTCDEAGLDAALVAGGGPHTFACGAPTTITTSTTKVITKDVILDGDGYVTISGGSAHRVLEMTPSVSLELRNMTISNGYVANGHGGGILNAAGATVTIVDSTISNNRTHGYWSNGAGIHNMTGALTITRSVIDSNLASGNYSSGGGVDNWAGTLVVTDSTISNNQVWGDGGGIRNYYGSASIVGSTIVGNRASSEGGGVSNREGPVTVVNSTISGNSAYFGGGLHHYYGGDLTVRYSTITANYAPRGGGIMYFGTRGHVTVGTSIVAKNGGHYGGVDCEGVITSAGHNVVGDSVTGCSFATAPGDVVGSATAPIDPMLTGLGDFGGLTLTHGVAAASVAVNLVPLADCAATDQRGVARPFGLGCDAGAFELEYTDLPPVADDQTVTTPEDAPIDIQLTGSDPDGSLAMMTIETEPEHGTLEADYLPAPVTYTPDPDWNGIDTFTFTVGDDGGLTSEPATVTIIVTQVNDPPVANDDSATVAEDSSVAIDVLANDIDVDGDALGFGGDTLPSHGTLSFVSDTTGFIGYLYQPEPNYCGEDSFTYYLTDVSADSNIATVWIDVECVNDPPVADANGPYAGMEGSPVTLDASSSWDVEDDPAAGDITVYEWDLDDDGEYDDATGVMVPYVFGDNGSYTVGLRVTDSFGATDTDETTATVANVAPSVDAPVVVPEPSDEGEPVTASATFSDPGFDDSPFTCVVDYGDGGALQPATVTGNTCTGSPHIYADDETYAIQVTVTDKDGGSGDNNVFHQVDNVPPELTVDIASQTVQYSDGIADVTITGTDVAADNPLTATATGLPNGTALTPGGCVTNGEVVCTWTVSGIADVSAGTYDVAVTVTDPDGGATVVATTVVVEHEDASVSFADTNEVAVAVASDGGNSGAFSLTVAVQELFPDLAVNTAYPGDIGLADVSIALRPVGPGGSVSPTGACVETVSGTGYNGVLTVTCPFDTVDVNAYTVDVTVDGGFYTGGNEDALVVYDPSLGFTTGGGWFYWPGTDDKTNFGYTMKYNKKGNKVQGSFLLIRHLDDGTKYRVKSNALYGLALGGDNDMGWASFSGRATYLQPGWDDPKGNHEFVVYVEDYGEPGKDIDKVWLETHNQDGDVIQALSMDRAAADHAEIINGGNVVVPH